MKKRLLYFVIFLTGLSNIQSLHAQHAFVASGGNASGSGGNVSYSIGQVAFITAVGANASINQGVQQPYEFYTVGIDANPTIQLLCKVYPNPFTTSVILSVEGILPQPLQYRLYDMTGKMLLQQRVIAAETTIPMDGLPSAHYLLKLVDGKKEIKTFQIIKN